MKKIFKLTFLGCLIIISPLSAYADTIINYMTIANNIPVMAIKPDDQSQAWVRSAQRILSSTDETLSQTVVAMNTIAAKQGHPVFCFPQGILFDSSTVHDIILKTYAELVKTQGAAVSGMNISDILMLGMVSRYSCSATPASAPSPVAQASMPEPTLAEQPAVPPVSSPAPAPAAPTSSSMGTALPILPSASSPAGEQPALSSNPYGNPPTQEVVLANNLPTL